jgi:two-component system nitrate/nitrite response regulator NarL
MVAGARRGIDRSQNVAWLVRALGRALSMNVVVLTPTRLLGDGLAACFSRRSEIQVFAVVSDLSILRDMLACNKPHLVLIDVTQGIDLYDIRSIAMEHPDVALVALGLMEQRQDVIRCGRAGFAGYVARDASMDALCKALTDVVQGRLACPAEISCGLLRALFRSDAAPPGSTTNPALTRREGDVLQLIGQGLSNKEIARELSLSVATVKHHVHNILEKLNLVRRAQAMRRVRDAPWIATVAERPLQRQVDESVRR